MMKVDIKQSFFFLLYMSTHTLKTSVKPFKSAWKLADTTVKHVDITVKVSLIPAIFISF